MGKARPRGVSFVDERLDVWEALLPRLRGAGLPGFGDELELPNGKVRERPNVSRRMDDHLLPPARGAAGKETSSVAFYRPGAEGRELVRNDAHSPAGSVGGAAGRPDCEGLGRRCALTPFAEGTAHDVIPVLVSLGAIGAGPTRAGRSDHDPPTGDGVASKLGRRFCAQLESPDPPINGRNSSIGSGRNVVVERSELISSIVCRKRS